MIDNIEKLLAEIQAIRKQMDVFSNMAATLKAATLAIYSSNIMAGKIISAKTDYERNEAIKVADESLKTIMKAVEESCQTEKTS